MFRRPGHPVLPARPLASALAPALVLCLLGVAACGGSDAPSDGGSTGSASSETGGEEGASDDALDLDAPGDDLLSEQRWGGPVPGDTVSGSWRFPASYEPTGDNVPNNEAESTADGVDYRLLIGAYPGADDVAGAAEQLRSEAEGAGQTVELEELSIGGRDFVSVTQQDGEDSRHNLLHAPDVGQSFFLVVMEAGEPLDEIPQERLEEYYQTAASLEFEPA